MKRWAPALELAALATALAGAALRWGASGGMAGPGLNLFIHLLPVAALAAWFAARAMAGGTAWRFSGAELVVPAFALVHALSVLRASHRLPALELALAHLAFGLFLLLAVQALGRDGLSALLRAGLFTASVLALVQYAVIFPATADRVASEAVEIRNRHASYEPFAAFTGPNQLAAFLVLTLPLALGAVLDAPGLRSKAPAALALALGAAALVLTGSLGGWVAGTAGAAAFAALALTRRRGRRAAVAAGAALALGVALLAAFGPLLETAARSSHSLHVRRVYWAGAARLIAERPALGVGLGNFEDHYPRVKGEVQQETRLVHNDFLQVLAETGVVGLLVFVAFLGLGLRRAAAAEAEPAPDGPAPPRWLLPAAGAAAFVLLTLRFGDPSLLAGGAAWAGFAWTRSPAGPWTRLGAAAGFIAFLVHMTVEFLWVEPGTALALYAALALLLAFAPRPLELRLSPAACATAAAVLALLAAPLFILTGPALAADRELAEAKEALRSPDGAAAAVAFAEAAQAHNPLLDEAYTVYAAASFALAGDDPLRAEAALQAVDNAIALRPDHASHRVSAAQLNLALALGLSRQAGDVARARAAAHLRRALEHQEAAVALYPSHAQGRYDLGRILDLLGERGRAEAEFGEGLRLSELASKELEKRRDLQLSGVRRIRALARTGRGEEAAREAKRLLPLDGQGDVARILEAIRRSPELLRGVERSELDEVTRPPIEAAIDEVLKKR